MYKNIFLVTVHKFFDKNRIFELKNPDNFLDALYPERTYPYCLLKEKLKQNNISLNTYDYFGKSVSDDHTLIFLDIPPNIKKIVRKHPFSDKFLIIWESPIINKINNDKRNHKYFKKIFTWQNSLIDNKKYFKLNYANTIPTDINFNITDKHNLCCMIAGNKLKDNPTELYTERIKAIRWFEKNAPKDFNLYGRGWDKMYFKEPFIKLNRLTFLAKLLKPYYPSYMGLAKLRGEVYKTNKFAICYENSVGSDGYISEKIFDCFFYGCVPIYLGETNIEKYIPQNTFIDKRKFKTYEELYAYIKNMPDNEYIRHLENIKNFIKNDAIHRFSAENFTDTICNEIIR